jgi:small subunit ribosomal protein S1
MVEIGSVIEARVARLEPYGAWLKHNGENVLVLIPELSWQPIRHPQQLVAVGDNVRVLVQRYNYKDRVIVGSVKALHPEQNPYRKLARLEPGTVLHGRVTLVTSDDVSVELPDNACGHISKHLLRRMPAKGETIEAFIAALEVDEGRLWLEPARDPDRGPACVIYVRVPELVL